MIEPTHRWRAPEALTLDPALLAAGAERGVSPLLLRLLAGRGVLDPAGLAGFLASPEEGLHDPGLLPDAGAALRRVTEARARGERVLVYGDFDADGLTGLSILVLALRRLGIDAEPYVPQRLDEGHGLSLRAVERAVAETRTLILTADCGTSSGPEIDAAARLGIDVIVTDHHHAATWPAAVAVVNPHRSDGEYPDRRLTGAGVAWKVAHLLLGRLGTEVDESGLPAGLRDMADLALIGTVADVAPIIGENRSIAKLGLERLRTAPRPGLAALLALAGVGPAAVDLESIAFAVAPRLNAAGRVGEAARAARLLLAADRAAADVLAAEIEGANRERRDLTRTAVAEAQALLATARPAARAAAAPEQGPPAGIGGPGVLPAALLVRGEWPVGIIGLIAGRLAEDHGLPAVVATLADPEAGILRASCRGPSGFNLAEALIACGELLERHGGHASAAGFEVRVGRWTEFETRFLGLAAAAALPSGQPELSLDLVLPASAVDYALIRELALLEPTGPGNPPPTLGITGFTVLRARSAAGGHTQLVLKRERDVLDAIAFRRPDLAETLHEGDRVDVAARAASRRFGGFESLQLEVLDLAAEGTQTAVAQVRPGRSAGMAAAV